MISKLKKTEMRSMLEKDKSWIQQYTMKRGHSDMVVLKTWAKNLINLNLEFKSEFIHILDDKLKDLVIEKKQSF